MGQLPAEDQQSGGRASQGTEAGMHLIEMKNNGVKNGATIGSLARLVKADGRVPDFCRG